MGAAPDLPRLGLGGAAIGNLYRAVSDADAERTVLAALNHGMGYIDTAPRYGHGRSEMRIGTALRAWGGERPIISTKVGRVLDPAAPGEEGYFGFADPLPFRPSYDYSAAGVRRSLEHSLERLGLDHIDIALAHDLGAETHGAAHAQTLRQFLDGGMQALADAKAQGLIRAIGIGVNETAVCFEILERADLDCILLAGRYTLMEQPALTSGLLDLCAERGVTLIIGGVFNSGLLAEYPSAASTYDYAQPSEAVLERARGVWALCQSFGVEPQAAALHFVLDHPAVTSIVVGARSPAEIDDLARWRAAPPPDALWDALKENGTIDKAAPVGRARG